MKKIDFQPSPVNQGKHCLEANLAPGDAQSPFAALQAEPLVESVRLLQPLQGSVTCLLQPGRGREGTER